MGSLGRRTQTLAAPRPWCCVLQLDQICISFDEGKTTMNFMEAALLIQGSACVYSKKVGAAWLLVSHASIFRDKAVSCWHGWQAHPLFLAPPALWSPLLLPTC